MKERDYMFDTFRGILMLSIPLSHFTKASSNWYMELWYGSGFNHESLSGWIYVTINVFVMQAFMFLSGYFSKKPERARETAFRGVLWPYLVFTTLAMIASWGFGCRIGHYFDYLTPSFALWFLLALFLYRYFLIDVVKFKWALPMSIVMFFAAGVLPFGQFLALGRVFSYFPFFLIGYYCSKETLDKVRTLKKKPVVLILLAAALVYMSYFMMTHVHKMGWFLLKTSCDNYGMTWAEDALFRAILFALACGWIVLMVNILPSTKNFLSFVGVNTMPVYVFHLGLRHIITQYGVYMGCVSTLFVAWFSLISLVHKKHGNWAVSTVITILSIAGIVALCVSGTLEPLYYGCPENIILYYVLVFGSALLAGVSFVAPFWTKLYSLLVDGPLRAPLMTKWLQGKGKTEEKK